MEEPVLGGLWVIVIAGGGGRKRGGGIGTLPYTVTAPPPHFVQGWHHAVLRDSTGIRTVTRPVNPAVRRERVIDPQRAEPNLPKPQLSVVPWSKTSSPFPFRWGFRRMTSQRDPWFRSRFPRRHGFGRGS